MKTVLATRNVIIPDKGTFPRASEFRRVPRQAASCLLLLIALLKAT